MARAAQVLLVEDNLDDVFLTRAGLVRSQVSLVLHHVPDGKECMAFLRREGSYEGAPTPDLILLDLNMPVMNGFEVMREVAADENLCALPVVVLTTSESEQDILKMYRLRCSSYLTKPVDFNQFQTMIRDFSEYWFRLVLLPPNPHPTIE